jgi:DNA gyrase/topoisomerase IV subunit B
VTEHVYSAADITVMTMAESVCKRLGMYFGVARGNSRLATAVLEPNIRICRRP